MTRSEAKLSTRKSRKVAENVVVTCRYCLYAPEVVVKNGVARSKRRCLLLNPGVDIVSNGWTCANATPIQGYNEKRGELHGHQNQ